MQATRVPPGENTRAYEDDHSNPSEHKATTYQSSSEQSDKSKTLAYSESSQELIEPA